eukprot:3605147-Rhodomonas_salina.1
MDQRECARVSPVVPSALAASHAVPNGRGRTAPRCSGAVRSQSCTLELSPRSPPASARRCLSPSGTAPSLPQYRSKAVTQYDSTAMLKSGKE